MTPDDLITAARLVELHHATISQHGGLPGWKDRNQLDSAVGAAVNAALYTADDPERPDVLQAAGYLLFYIARGHAAVDGNKRLGWLALVDVLRRQGLTVDASQREVIDFVSSVASGDVAQGDVVRWVAERLVSAIMDE